MNVMRNNVTRSIVKKIQSGLKVDEYTAEDLLYKIFRHISNNSNIEEVIQCTRLPLVTIIDIIKRLHEVNLSDCYIEDLNQRLEKKYGIIKKVGATNRAKHKTKIEYDQWKCSIDTCIKRVKRLINDNYLFNRKILFLGDEDLTSVFLALTINNIAEIHVVDIDCELLELIEELNTKLKLDIKTYNLDLRAPMPEYLRNRFDIFFTDPPFRYEGISLFLLQGFLSLKSQLGTKGYLCISPLSLMGDIYKVQQLIYNKGFYIDEIVKSFNIYPGLEENLPCISADLYILKRAKNITITDEEFKMIPINLIYTPK